MTDRDLPIAGQMTAYVDFEEPPPGEGYTRPSETADLDKANLITSLVAGQPDIPVGIDPVFGEREGKDFELHKVVIDLDLPAQLLPSTTEGHHHLFIDHEIEWPDYLRLLEALAACGLIEEGYLFASKERGYTCVRLPWVKKKARSEPEPLTPDNTDPLEAF